jgi:hypothetical protein
MTPSLYRGCQHVQLLFLTNKKNTHILSHLTGNDHYEQHPVSVTATTGLECRTVWCLLSILTGISRLRTGHPASSPPPAHYYILSQPLSCLPPLLDSSCACVHSGGIKTEILVRVYSRERGLASPNAHALTPIPSEAFTSPLLSGEEIKRGDIRKVFQGLEKGWAP